MTTKRTTRRTILAGAASLPVAAIAVAPASPPDDSIIALAERTIEAWRALEAANAAYQPFDVAMIEWRENNPMPQQTDISELVDPVFDPALENFDPTVRRVVQIIRMPKEKQDRLCEADRLARAEWEERERGEKRRCGYTKAAAAECTASDHVTKIIAEFYEMQPRTFAGLAAKARAARITGDDGLCQQLSYDIGVMTGEITQAERDGFAAEDDEAA